jgi:hypothetical protein
MAYMYITWEKRNARSTLTFTPRVILGRSIFFGIHPEKFLLHGTLVIIVITSVPWIPEIVLLPTAAPHG